MDCPCTEPARVRAFESLPRAGGPQCTPRLAPHSPRDHGDRRRASIMEAKDMSEEIENTRRLAEHVGLKLIEQRDGRNGQYRLQHGRDIVAHSDDLKDLQGFAMGWRSVR